MTSIKDASLSEKRQRQQLLTWHQPHFPQRLCQLLQHLSITSAFIFFIIDSVVLKMSHASAVPNPDPTRLDSKFIEPSKQQLHFHPSGQQATSMNYVHIWVPFNFSQMIDFSSQVSIQYKKYTKNQSEPFKSQTYWVAKISESCLNNKIDNFNDLLDMLIFQLLWLCHNDATEPEVPLMVSGSSSILAQCCLTSALEWELV